MKLVKFKIHSLRSRRGRDIKELREFARHCDVDITYVMYRGIQKQCIIGDAVGTPDDIARFVFFLKYEYIIQT